MSRALLACLIVLGACAVVSPSAALANGPSAGDQQYIDPLAGSSHHGSSPSKANTTPSSANTTPSSPSAPASSTGSSSATTTGSSSASTTSSPTTATRGHDAPGSSSHGLPMTGLDLRLAVLTGVLLLGSGVLLRRFVR